MRVSILFLSIEKQILITLYQAPLAALRRVLQPSLLPVFSYVILKNSLRDQFFSFFDILNLAIDFFANLFW
jgi:hypothetical protein